jgi:hypothetical protein
MVDRQGFQGRTRAYLGNISGLDDDAFQFVP